jgi:uroporphyrinogen decarboxylase
METRFRGERRAEIEQIIWGDMRSSSVGWSTSYYLDDKPYIDEWGVGWDVQSYQTPFGSGYYTEIRDHPLSEDSDIASYEPPDPDRPELYKSCQKLVSESKDDHWIVGSVHATIFETAWALRGLEQMLLDLVMNPDLAKVLLNIPYHYHLVVAKKMVAIGVDMVFLGDDVGSQNAMMISPQMWRKYLKPLMANMIAELKKINPNLKIAYHTDGNVEPIIEELIEIGIDVLNPIQPRSMDPARLKKQCGDRLCFWGTIDEQHTLPFGSPEDVASEVKARLETVGYDGGLILAPTHAVQLDTPLENFYSLVDAICDITYEKLKGKA